MFSFLKNGGKNKELEILIAGIESNVANNYKDAAQEALKKYESMLVRLTENGSLNDKQRGQYEAKLTEYKNRLKEFTHKDQKPYWT